MAVLNTKLKGRRIKAIDLRLFDIILFKQGKKETIGRVTLKDISRHGWVTFTVIDTEGYPCVLPYLRDEVVTKITDDRISK